METRFFNVENVYINPAAIAHAEYHPAIVATPAKGAVGSPYGRFDDPNPTPREATLIVSFVGGGGKEYRGESAEMLKKMLEQRLYG